MRFRVSGVASATGGRLVGPDVEIDGASFDSRTLRPGQLFVPIVADRDGHDFILAAVGAGAAAYLTEREPLPHRADDRPTAPAIVVTDTSAALMDLGRWARRRLPDRVVGITGSVGKTSVKDLMAAALRTRWRTAANVRSFNNEQGLPVTLLEAPDDTEVLVLEMGMRGFGQIAELCDVGRPTIGVVTAVADAHTELLGGLEGVARAKGELIEALPADGVAVLNADQPLVAAMAQRTAARALTFGTGAADVAVRELSLDRHGRARFTLETPWGSAPVALGRARRAHGVERGGGRRGRARVGGPARRGRGGGRPGRHLAVADGAPAPALRGGGAQRRVQRQPRVDAGRARHAPRHRCPAAVGRPRRHGRARSIQRRRTRRSSAHARSLGIEVVAVGTELYGTAPVDDVVVVLGPLGEGDAVLVKGSRVAGLEAVAARLLRPDGPAS